MSRKLLKFADRLRISVQLISTSDARHLWTDHYDRVKANEFAIQDELSLAITEKIKTRLFDLNADSQFPCLPDRFETK